MSPWQISLKALIYPQLEGQITHLIWLHSCQNRKGSFRRHTSCSSSSHYSSLHQPSGDGCCHHPHAVIPICIVGSHPTFTTSPTDTTHITPQTRAGLAPSTPTEQHKDLSPEKSSNAQDPQDPINPTSLRLSPSRIPLQILHQILTVTVII